MQWATATTQQGFGDEDKKTLTVEDLQSWMDEGYLKNCFAHTTQESFSTKVFRNLQTGESEGYGVINFCTHADAEKVFQTYNGITMPQTEQPFQLNWASSSVCDKRSDLDSEYSLFVGNLAPDVTSTLLGEFFLRKYPSVTEANVVFDENTGRSKSIGFVTFSDDNERSQARTELNGIYFHGRPMHTGFPNRRISFGSQQQSSPQGGYASSGAFAQKVQCDEHFINTTIYVGGLDPSVSLEDLRQTFSQYGETTSVRIPGGKGFGFVKFANRSNAEEALQKLHRTVIGKQTVYLSWCKNPANKQLRVNRGNQWSGTYYGSKISEGYGYAATPLPDSSMPGGAYGTYPVYGNHQQEEFLAITHHDKSVQSLISPSIPDIAAQPTPSATKDKLCGNDLSSSGNLSGWMDSESTPNKTHIPSDAVFSVQEYMGQSASEGITEILRPLQKASEGEVTEAPMSLEPCHSKGLSFGSHADVESEIVLSSTKKGPELEVANKDITVVHTESRQLLSFNSEEHKCLTLCLEKCNPPILEENGGNLLMSNEAITPQNAPVKSLKEAWSSNLVESSSSLEKTFNDQYNNAIGDERALHSSDDVSTTLNSTLSERDLPSDVVFASQENMMQLAPENVKSSRPLKKGGQEVTEVPIFLKACNARGVSVGSRTDVEAQFILSSITTKDVIEVEHSEDIGLLAPHAKFQEKHFIVQPTGQIQEPLCGDQSDQPEGVASQTENVSKKKGRPKGKKCSGGRPQAVSLGMALESEGLEHDSTINEVTDSMTSYVAEESQPLLPKQIDLQEVGVANQTENLLKRKRGRPKGSGGKQKRGRPEAVSSGMTFEVQVPSWHFIGPRRESTANEATGSQMIHTAEEHESHHIFHESMITEAIDSHTSSIADEQHTLYLSFEKSESLVDNKDKDPELEAGSKEMMFIQTECTQLLSPAEEETPTSFPCLENSDAPMSENNGDQQLMPNVVINAVDASTHSFKHIESSTVAGNSLSLVEFVDDHYDNARGYESDTHISVEGTTATHLSPSRHIEACRSLPFIKSSLLWESVESMEVFKILPQQPHFCPLEQYNEVAREGMAIGKMLIFANLLEKTGRVKLDEPRSTLEDKLEALMDIEECGFTVQPIRTRLEELLSIKDSINELDDKSKAIEREVSDEKLKYDEVVDSLEQLNMELQVLVMDKEMKDRNVAELQRTIDEIQENIEDVRSEFNRLVASPWWTSIGDELSQNI